MELNISSFGAGVGLVMVGWASGLVISYVFALVRRVGSLG